MNYKFLSFISGTRLPTPRYAHEEKNCHSYVHGSIYTDKDRSDSTQDNLALLPLILGTLAIPLGSCNEAVEVTAGGAVPTKVPF